MKFFRRRWYVVLILLLIVGFIFYQRQNAAVKATKDSVYTVKRQTLEEDLSLSGKIDAEEKATLHFQSSGRLVWAGVKEGDYVKKNQGIASLDVRDIQLRLKKYLNTYEKTRRDFDQSQSDTRTDQIGGLTKDLREKAIRSFEKAQFDLNNSVLDVEIQNLASEYAYLYSPIDGILVQATSLYPGIIISPAVDSYVVVNPDSVYFSATADQTDVPQLTKLHKGAVVLDAYPDETMPGSIDQIAFTPKEGESGTVYEVKLILRASNSTYKYRLGMTGDVSFVLRKKEHALAVPSRFIKTEQGKKYVFKVTNGNKVKTFITTGETYDIDTEIISGLMEGDVVSE